MRVGPLDRAQTAQTADRKTRVLVREGFSSHDWQQTTALILEILNPNDLFELDVRTAPEKIILDDGSAVRIRAGEGSNTGHGQRGRVLVIRPADAPVHAGMRRAWLSRDREVQFHARGPVEQLPVLTYVR
jgi:hypothetical protein